MLLKIPDTFTLETEADVRALRDLLDCLPAPRCPHNARRDAYHACPAFVA